MVIMQEWDPRLGMNNTVLDPVAGPCSLKLVLEPEKRNLQGVIKGGPVLISTERLTLSAPAPRVNEMLTK